MVRGAGKQGNPGLKFFVAAHQAQPKKEEILTKLCKSSACVFRVTHTPPEPRVSGLGSSVAAGDTAPEVETWCVPGRDYRTPFPPYEPTAHQASRGAKAPHRILFIIVVTRNACSVSQTDILSNQTYRRELW